MMLTNPILLWSLLGLSVPVAIHLLSRKEGHVIKLGSVRYVQETSTQQFKGVKLNELLLLALRCALILVFCLLLSGLTCTGVSNQKWVAVEAGLENNLSVKSILDSLKKEGYELRQWCDGFPTVASDCPLRLNYWTLIEQLRQKNLASVVVLSQGRLVNFRGQRTSLPSNVTWITVPEEQTDFPIEAIRFGTDSIYVRTGHSNADQTFFTNEKVKSFAGPPAISPPDSIHVTVLADEQYRPDKRILMASLQAIRKTFPVVIKIEEPKPDAVFTKKGDWLFWFSDMRLPETNLVSTMSLIPSSSGNLIERQGPMKWYLTKRLNVDIALSEDFTVQLAHLIIPSKREGEIMQANDRRTMPDSLAWSAAPPPKPLSAAIPDANRPLMIFLIALLLFERIVAYRRNQ